MLDEVNKPVFFCLLQFFLQDTKSSNGTFINNQRLSKGSEESAPHELFSSDVVQFGVDVMENSRRGKFGSPCRRVSLFIDNVKVCYKYGDLSPVMIFTISGIG